MSQSKSILRLGALALAAGIVSAAPVFALALPDLEALAKLERGRWQVADGQSAPRAICIGDPVLLLQLEHGAASCEREVLANESGVATVQYTCAGRGFGHTSIRVETPRLARIDTQGLVDGRPFSYRVEARRVGSC